MATIQVNGQKREVTLPLTIEALIKASDVAQPDMVSVQVNEEFLGRQEFATRQVQEGDEVEFLYFMGGGQADV